MEETPTLRPEPSMRPTCRAALLTILFAALAVAGCATPPRGTPRQPGMPNVAPTDRTSALAVDSALAVTARAPLWPGFEPLRVPLAIFDGERTYLFRHPSPPSGYAPVAGGRDILVRDG